MESRGILHESSISRGHAVNVPSNCIRTCCGSFVAVWLCGVNSVSRNEIEAVKPGDTITYRIREEGKSWFYIDKVTRVDGDTTYYQPSRMRSSISSDGRLYEFDTNRQLSIKKAEILAYKTEQEPDDKKMTRIE